MTSQPLDGYANGVPLTVPKSWKGATLGQPVPVVRCTYIYPDTHSKPGEQCRAWSLRGCLKCIKHGGNLPNVRAHAEAVVESARLRLIGSTDQAVDWLLDLAENSTSDAVRLKATTEVMDRAGVKGGMEVDVNVTHSTDPAELLRERLATLRKRTIEGEIAKRTAEQVALEATVEPPDGTVADDTPPI